MSSNKNKKTTTMKFLFLFAVCLFSLTVIAQEQEQEKTFEFGFGLRIESLPYAPVNAAVIGEKPVVIGTASMKYVPLKTNISLWQSVDVLGGGGTYTGLLVFQPVTKNLTFSYIHFFDFTFEKFGANILALKASGGEDLKWSLKLSDIIFNSRSPRYVLQSNFTYGQFIINSWNYYEFGVLTWTAGMEWKSPKLKISERWNLNVNAVFNDSLTKRFNWSDGFGQPETFSIGLEFSPNTDTK
jgi:hypothetical protein